MWDGDRLACVYISVRMYVGRYVCVCVYVPARASTSTHTYNKTLLRRSETPQVQISLTIECLLCIDTVSHQIQKLHCEKVLLSTFYK